MRHLFPDGFDINLPGGEEALTQDEAAAILVRQREDMLELCRLTSGRQSAFLWLCNADEHVLIVGGDQVLSIPAGQNRELDELSRNASSFDFADLNDYPRFNHLFQEILFKPVHCLSGFSLTGRSGDFLGYLCVFDPGKSFLSLSQRHGLEILGRSMAQQLEMTRAHELLLAEKEQAEAAKRAREVFLSTMSHEIRTPLNAVIGLTNLMLQELEAHMDQQEHLTALKFSAQNLLGLVNNVLDYNKLETGNMEQERVDFDLLDLVTGVRSSLQHPADNKGISLHCDFDERLPRSFCGDPLKLTQVLTNLLSNAVKFTEKGGVTLKVFRLKEGTDRTKVGFEVQDTGIGIHPDELSCIFEPFNRGNKLTIGRFNGTGLGLSITRRLLDIMSGNIEVRSEPGSGSVFSFSLTLDHAKPAAARDVFQREEAGTPAELSGVRILLVEDNDINALIAKKFLRRWGALVEHAIHGLEAVDMLRESPDGYDIVLMDVQMPVMNGFEASRYIRDILLIDKVRLPIMAITASILEESLSLSLAAGMNGCITKPFNPEELLRQINKMLHTITP